MRLQLNWFHDPTFAGEYRTAEQLGRVTLLEGGANVVPLQRLKAGLAHMAIVGIDIALQAVEADIQNTGATSLRIVFADHQRNPVGWILHPRAARQLGYNLSTSMTGRQRNDWLFARFRDGSIRPGDKRGTETTAVWASWRQVRGLQGVNVTPVGFDPTIVLQAPPLAYPVYLNEEPLKLAERIGEPVLVFDPADDGVVLYGNVLVTTQTVLEQNQRAVTELIHALGAAWQWVRSYPDSAAAIVRMYYRDVADSVLVAQVRRTVDLVFYGGASPGSFDLADDGRMSATINALRAAGTISNRISMDVIRPIVVEVQEPAR